RLYVFFGNDNNNDDNNKNNSIELTSSNSSVNLMKLVNSEPTKTELSQLLVLDPTVENWTIKRKEWKM
ncbi:hypothetical protein Gogos_006790, partial [Gossypium gossypioides]|nr:hypothetical protein [Gossypium gossypioides]